MAWIYERSGVWWIGYRHNGKQVRRSIKTPDRAEAERELSKVRMMFEAHKTKSLTEELFHALTGGGLPRVTLIMELDGWLAEAKHQTEPSTISRYISIADELKSFLSATENGPMLADVTTADLTKFLVQKRSLTAASTTNVTRKILAGFFKRAVSNNRLRENPVSPIKQFKAQKGEKKKRRAFTLNELAELYEKAPDAFWRYMIQGEFYTGLRMVDLICLRLGAIDMAQSAIRLEDEKTEKAMFIPLAKPFKAILQKIIRRRGKGKPSDFLWPEQAARHQSYKSGSGYFSNQFYEKMLAPCGLVPKREGHRAAKNGPGRRARRKTNEVSFHCIRHSFVSFLKSAGANQAVAKELAGHSNDQVNDLYTHVPERELTNAINLLPEFAK
jgi:integrase